MTCGRERKAKGGKQPKQNSSAIMFCLTLSVSSFHWSPALCRRSPTLSSTEPQRLEFRLHSLTLVPNRRRSFTTSSPDIPSIQARDDRFMRGKRRGFWDSVCMLWELEGLSLLKVVEVLPEYFVFIVKYSVRMVDRGNFCSQPTIQKWKGCGLWMKGAREIDTHGASW